MENKTKEIIELAKKQYLYDRNTGVVEIEEQDLQAFAEGIIKLFAIPVVSHRRELLFALLEWIDYGDGEDRENIVDRFSKDFEANNCG